MPNPRIVVIGNCTLDLAFNLPRFPKPGETLLATGASQDVGGKGANQAVAAARSGASVSFCSAVGRDLHGTAIRQRLEGEGVPSEHVAEVDAPTDLSIVHVTPEGQNSIVSTCAAAASMEMAMVRPLLREAVAGDILLMQGNLSRDLTRACLIEGRQRGMTTVLNPAPIHYDLEDLWPLVDCAVPNEVEAEHLTKCAEAAAGARRLLALGAGQAIVTLGAAGALLAREGRIAAIEAESVDTVDTTGAGDVFCGVFAAALGRGLDPARAVRVATGAATLSVTRPGTQRAFPHRLEINRLFQTVEARDEGPYPAE